MDNYRKKHLTLNWLINKNKHKNVEQVYSILMNKYDTKNNKYLSEIFNFCLVYCGIRKCILLESVNYIFISTLQKLSKNIVGFLYTNSRTINVFVYNKNIINILTYNDISNNEKIGYLLDFQCPGEMNGNNIIQFMINNINFYTEICNDSISKKMLANIEKKYMLFNELALKLNLNITKNINFKLTLKQAKILVRDKNYNSIFCLKNEYGNMFINFYYYITGSQFHYIKTTTNMKTFIDRYDKLLLVILEYIINDPLKIITDTSIDDNIKIKELIAETETNLYNIF